MPAFRADLYLTAVVRKFDIDEHSKSLFEMLKKIPELDNLSITKMSREGEDWYDIIGGIKVPEGARAFEALCKEIDIEEPYNFFMRIDRNIAAESYDEAQLKAKEWVERAIARPLTDAFQIVWVRIEGPPERRRPKRGGGGVR